MSSIAVQDSNREGWLIELARLTEPIFRGFALRPYRLTCGWPSKHALGQKVKRVGECHYPRPEGDGVKIHDIFVSPLIDDSVDVAGIVVHEVTHVAAGFDAGHGPKFVKICKHVGLTKGKPTSASPGEELKERLQRIVQSLGPYPHTKIVPSLKPVKPSSDVKLVCPCGCKATMSRKWVEEAGVPTCGCGGKFGMIVPGEGE